MNYPVLDILPKLKTALQENRVVLLQAPPGAGKSTILPTHLLEEPWLSGKKIIMLEPRRLAAKSVALRMSMLRDEQAGNTVGYRVRFDSKVSASTRIEVVTEGILTRMIQSDNSLADVGLLIFDEFHERSLHADLALALALQVQDVLRSDLRILIMSATLGTENLTAALGNIPVIVSEGRQHPVDVIYEERPVSGPVIPRVVPAIQKAYREREGDILVFLPGAGEIRRVEEALRETGVTASVHPLYGDLSFREQQDAILPRSDGGRKIVLATSIAETSLTIEGVRVVVDSGLARVPRFDPRSSLTRLETIPVTMDAAEQRKGRAGRIAPGTCYRLWTEGQHRNLVPQRKPEILEADLATLVLELANWGVMNVQQLIWITVPPPGPVSQALDLLKSLGALNATGITSRGKEMLRLPTHPRIAHMLLEAGSRREKSLACDIAAVLEERDPLTKDAGADLSLRVEELRKWRSGARTAADRNVLERIDRLAKTWHTLLKIDPDQDHPAPGEVGKLLVAVYPERIARQQHKQSEVYTLANGRTAKLPDHDPLVHEPWICVAQLDAGNNQGKIFLAAPVDGDRLQFLSVEERVVRWDDERGMVDALTERKVGGLVLESRVTRDLRDDESAAVICRRVKEEGLKMIGWGEGAEALQSRILSLRVWRPQEEWPDVSPASLLSSVDEWLPAYLPGIRKRSELAKLDGAAILRGFLIWQQQDKLDKLAPERLEVPSGSMIRIQYFDDGRAPVMEVRLQEMFGLGETPAVNEGRTPILLHLLSPGYKPVQVTQDLRNFWETTYFDVRKELRMRYPKHSWPEDPWTAQAVRGVKRKKF